MKELNIGQKQKNFLKQSVFNKRLSHAYIFVGESGVGKIDVAEWFAQEIKKEVKQSWDYQLWQIYPEKSESGESSSITINQMREVKHRTDLRFGSEGHQVVIIHQAHLMNYYAQDALLKALEEPKNQTIFILLTDYLQALRPTIQSRCQIVHFTPLSFKQSLNWLVSQGINQKRAELIALISQGRARLLIQLKNNPEIVEQHIESMKELLEIYQAPLYQRFRFAEKASQDRQFLSQLMNDWLVYWRALLLIKSLNLKVNLPEAKEYDLVQVVDMIDRLEKTESVFRQVSLNKRLALEQLLI